MRHRWTVSLLILSGLTASACSDGSAPTRIMVPGPIARSGSGSGSGGGGGGGGGTSTSASGGGGGGGGTVSGVSILPTTAPAPDVLLRESFGPADGQRPASGNGVLKSVSGSSLAGFWLE
jgi:hypothetical protein